MRILITGGTGQLGSALASVLGSAHDVHAPGHAELDVCDSAAVRHAVDRIGPDAVIHCAALTDTARCEREPDLAQATNALAPEYVARACASKSARLIVISTNEVFDGTAAAAYAEDSHPCPVNMYGASKLEGELLAAKAYAGASIVRTSWLYGDGERNFVAKVLSAARDGRPLRFVTDEVATPTSCDDLADAILRLMMSDAAFGVYHLINEGQASRYEWAREILRLAGMDADVVQPMTTEELRATGYHGPRKPPYSVLANNRARALGITLRPWRDALAARFEAHAELRAPSPPKTAAHG